MGKAREANIEKAVSLVKKAAEKGAKIICLPELFSSLYFPQNEKDENAKNFAEPQNGPIVKRMALLAKELSVVLIVPFYEKEYGKYYNSVSVVDESGKILGTYRKMHIPHDHLFYEKNYFNEANGDYLVFKTKYAKISPLICFDQWFPEAARICALKGAEIILYPTAIGLIAGEKTEENWRDAWETVQRGHAISNSVHVAAVNRVGKEGNLKFWGSSFVCDSFGKIIKKASLKEEEILIADVDLSNNERIREGWGFFRNRRPKSYETIMKN